MEGKMEDLVESILDYVRSDYTDYAIMINGEWGVGKTHFWNNKIRKKIESMQLNGKRYTTIYMSLYGISNLEDISKKIFIETTQLMDKNLRKFMEQTGQTTIPEYAKTGLDMANFFGVTQNGDKLDYGEFFSTDDKVLCFDDLMDDGQHLHPHRPGREHQAGQGEIHRENRRCRGNDHGT